MVDPAQDVQFYWLAADGTRQTGTERALRAALSGEALIATTLVWRRGWSEWLPANRVAELSSSIPELEREQAQDPGGDLRVADPPATPGLGKVPALGPRPVVAASTGSASNSLRAPLPSTQAKPNRGLVVPTQHARDTLSPSSFGTLGPSRRPAAASAREAMRPSGTPPPPPMRGRSPMPTLGEERTAVSVTATLRPPGAVPPPARGVPVPAFDSSPRASAGMTPVPVFGPAGGRFATPHPTSLPAVAGTAPLADGAPPSIESRLDSTLEVGQQVPAEARRTPIDPVAAACAVLPSGAGEEARRPAYRDSLVKIGRIGLDTRTVVMGLSALSGALFVAVIGLWMSHSRTGASAEAVPSASSAT
ncbi:MAG: hypothetical protein ABIQ16_00170, partial [Polyangiaceae bacterium]